MAKKGRNPHLIELRNKKLIERYFYWYEVKRKRYDDVLKILSEEEFFISISRIEELLKQNNEDINQLIEDSKPKNQMEMDFKND